MHCVELFEISYEVVCCFNWILHRNIINYFNVFYNRANDFKPKKAGTASAFPSYVFQNDVV